MENLIHKPQTLRLALLVAFGLTNLMAQTQAQPSPSRVAQENAPPMRFKDGRRDPFGMPPGMTLPSFSWTKEPWTASDKPFLALRTSIDQKVKARKNQPDNLRALVDGYEAKAKKQPLDAQAQFAWAYSAYQASANGFPLRSGWGKPRELSLALSQPESPHSYQYARLRFLMAGRWRTMPEIIPLSQRLLQRNPQDYSTKFYAVRMLSKGSEQQVRQAVRLAQEMMREQPKKRSSYSSLAQARWGLFVKTDNKQDGKAALIAGEKYLSMLPKNSPSRAESEDIVRTIRQALSRRSS